MLQREGRGGRLFKTSPREPDERAEAEDICLDIWVQAPLAFGMFGSRREDLNFPEMLVRLVGSVGATLAGNPPEFPISL